MRYRYFTPLLLSLSLLTGCGTSGISPETRELALPDQWQREPIEGTVPNNWLAIFSDDQLNTVVAEAMLKNFDLATQSANVEIARQAVVITRADRIPGLDLSVSRVRRGLATNQNVNLPGDFTLTLSTGVELDIWRRLSKAQRSAQLNLMAAEALYQDTRRRLAAQTAQQWFNLIEARQLLVLFRERLDNLSQSAVIVESGYRQGINEALDVFLAQNTVEQEQANVASQEQLVLQAGATLQRLLARYPDGAFTTGQELPTVDAPIPAGVPSELLTRRADVQNAWLSLMASDADLAVAHRARFPAVSLTADASDNANTTGDLFDGQNIAWQVLLSLSQPLFDNGRLAALEKQARERVKQAEQAYLTTVFTALEEVENAISQNRALLDQLASLTQAADNAQAALDLAFDQYQQGLVDYTTVLESQRRAFDAQTSVVRLKNQLLQNRIALYLALGGEFEVTS